MLGDIGAGRAAALIVAGFVGLALVASVQAVVPLRVLPGLRPGPDVALLVVLFVGLLGRGGPAGVGAVAVTLGYLADLSGGSPKGLHMVACLAIALFARLASSRLLVRGALFTALVAGFFAALYHLLLACLRVALDPAIGWGPFGRVPLAVLSTALFAPLVFALLARIDRISGRFFGRDVSTLGGRLGRKLDPLSPASRP